MPADRIQREPRDKPSRPPTKQPMIIENFAEVWLRELMATGYDEYGLAIPEAGPYRASWASKRCDRQLQYALAGVEPSDPLEVADYWRMHLGTMVHNSINSAVRTMGDGWIPDIDVDLRTIGIPGSGHADLVRFVDEHDDPWEYRESRPMTDGSVDRYGEPKMEHCYATTHWTVWVEDGKYDELMLPTHVAELKSVGGYAFKMAATAQSGPPEGPRYGAVLQGALAAWALGVDKLLVVNLSLECVSPNLARAYSTTSVGRFAAEWKYTIDEMMDLLEHERDRINAAILANADGMLVARELHDPEAPVGAIISSPATSTWRVVVDGDVAQAGKMWGGQFCQYCPHFSRCCQDGAGMGADS